MHEIADNAPQPPSLTPTPRSGLAIASLVLGILSFFLSLFLVGGLLGLIGLLLGVSHIRTRAGFRALAWWGTALSIAGIIASCGLGIFYYRVYQQFAGEFNAQAPEADAENWQGVLAPDIDVKTLEGETIKLSSLRGKRVVLDFWATWCPPCVKEIPHFIQLFKETSRDQVIIVGISSEDESVLKPFIKKQNIPYPIASASDLPSPYKDIKSIPTTLFIDRNGIIQHIAVGYHDFATIKEHALAEDVKAEPKPAPSTAANELKQSGQMLAAVAAWKTRIPEAAGLAAADWDGTGSSEILVVAGKQLHVLSSAGTELATVTLPEPFTLIEAGRKGSELRLLGYSNWGKKVSVMSVKGTELWSYSSGQGVNGAHWGDLDGDGADELIVGLNGSGGLHAVSADGKNLWKVTSIGNVWNQAVIPEGKNRSAMVFATEAGGTVRVYDAKGKLQRTIRPQGKYCASMAARIVHGGQEIQGVAVGETEVIAFSEGGTVAWSTGTVKENAGWRGSTFASGDVNGDGDVDWVFRGTSNDLVVANWKGEKLAAIPNQTNLEDFILVPAKGKSLLVTLRKSEIIAYEFGAAMAQIP